MAQVPEGRVASVLAQAPGGRGTVTGLALVAYTAEESHVRAMWSSDVLDGRQWKNGHL